MCWISKNAEKLTATENIPIYKVLEYDMISEKLYSYYYRMKYELGVLYSSNIYPHTVSGVTEISQGLHCYNSNCMFRQRADAIVLCANIFEPSVRFSKLFSDRGSYKVVVARGYIPTGATYYINDLREIVTTKLVLTNVLVQ
jgi:hypothetical protein